MKHDPGNYPSCYHVVKSLAVAASLVFAASACEESPSNPTPPQVPPKPQVSAGQPNAGNEYPGLYDPSSAQRAVFEYSSDSELEFQNAQGKTIKRLVIRT